MGRFRQNLFFCLLMVGISASPGAQPKLIIATPGFDHPMAQVARLVLPEAYGQLGYSVEFRVLPPNRIIPEFEEGRVDGFIFSDRDFQIDRRGAILVPFALGNDDITVFGKKEDLIIRGWESLKGLVVGYQLGMLVVEEHLRKFDLKGDGSQNPPQAFQKCAEGRTDVVVMPLGVGLMMIKNLQLKGIYPIQPALEKVPLYHYLTSKNEALAAPLALVLAKMQKNGRFGFLQSQALGFNSH